MASASRYQFDAALGVAIAAGVLAAGLLGGVDDEAPAPLDLVLLVLAPLALALRRRAPRAVLLVAAACGFAYNLRVHPDPVATVAALVALYTATKAAHRMFAIVVALPLGAQTVIDELVNAAGSQTAVQYAIQEAILPVGWFVAAIVGGEVARQRCAYLHEAEQRVAEAERTREELAVRRAGEERLRIARELHDSLTHSISVIKLQAGVAIHLARKRGEAVSDALLAIQSASSDATRELRETLEVLRTDQPGPSSLDRLPDLLARARSTGLRVDLNVTGRSRLLPAEVDRAAYRIVQESLTNITRHAGPASAAVTLDYGADVLTVRVEDDGVATVDELPVPGVGLSGMRERVAALGGRLTARPAAGGGFAVRADLPAGIR